MAWAKPNKAAQHFGVSRRTIYNWMPLGLPHVKVSGTTLIDLTAGDNWLRENFTPGPDKNEKLVNEILKGFIN